MARGFDLDAATAVLLRADPVLGDWLARIGTLDVARRWRQPFDVVDALARSILFQQLSGKAAATIVGRIEVAAGSRRLDATALASIDDEELRGCGVSGNKVRALRDLVARQQAGLLPTPRQMARMDDEAIVQALSAVRGIGRWTAEMLLIFRLGRPDVLPLDDLGIRKGVMRIDALTALPDARTLLARGECWRPYRSLASLCLWRVVDGVAP